MRPLVVGPAEPIDVAGLGRRRPHVVDDGALQLERQRLAGLDQRDEALVRRVARLVDDPVISTSSPACRSRTTSSVRGVVIFLAAMSPPLS